jgi:hypothetical protein
MNSIENPFEFFNGTWENTPQIYLGNYRAKNSKGTSEEDKWEGSWLSVYLDVF